MSDGLKEKYRRAIIDILSSDEKVERIVLFGFRAMGTFRATSDVDIALFGDRLTLADQARFSEAVGMLSMPQEADILLYSSIESKKLIEHIERYGVEWYSRNEARTMESAMSRRSSIVAEKSKRDSVFFVRLEISKLLI